MRLTLLIVLCVPLGCDDNPPAGTHHDLSALTDMAMIPEATILTATDTLTNCIAIDSSFVYWTESSATMIPDAGSLSRLVKVAKMGGTPMVMLDAIDSPGCVVLDDESAYVMQAGNIMKVPLDGSTPSSLSQNQHVLPGSTPKLAAGGGYVYWITDVYGSVDAYNGMNALVRLSTSGGNVDTLFTDIVGSPGGIAVDATNVYYSDQSGMFARTIAGGAAMPLGQSTLHNNRFAIDSTSLALAEVAGIGMGDVAVSKLDGSGRIVVDKTLATSLAIDSTGVYADSNGVLSMFKLDGTGSVQLAESSPRAIALDASELYFTDGVSILRFAK